MGVRRRDQRRRRPVPAASRGTRPLSLHARRPVLQHRPADDPGALPGLSRARPPPTPTPTNTCWARTCWSTRSPSRERASPPRSGSRPAPGRTTSPGPPSPARPPRRSTSRPAACRSSSRPAGSSRCSPPPATPRPRAPHRSPSRSTPAPTARFSMYDDAGTGLGYQSGQSAQTPITYTENVSAETSTVTIGPATGSYSGEPSSRTTRRPGRRVAADLSPAQRPDARLLSLELQQRRPHAPGADRRGRNRLDRDHHPDRRHPGAAGGADHADDHVHLSRHRRGRPAGHGHRQRLRGDPGE